MADIKITDLTAATSVSQTDILPAVLDPSGTPVNRKVTLKTLLDSRLIYTILGSDYSLTSGTSVQSAFSSAQDVITLSGAKTYLLEGEYYITKSGSSATTALAFALGGGASITFIRYHALAQNTAVNTTGATFGGTWVDQVASTVVNATAAGDVVIRFRGLLRMNVAGTVTPQIQFSAAPTSPVMKIGSYLMLTELGGTDNTLGTVA